MALLISNPTQAETVETQVGEFLQVEGDVLRLSGGVGAKALVKMPIFLQDAVATGAKSQAVLQFQDKSVLALKENTKVLISQMLIDGNTRQSRFEVLSGKVRAVVETVYDPKTSRTELKTPTSIVGIRGTDFLVEVTPGRTKIYCIRGRVHVYNPRYPSRVVEVVAGLFTDVLIDTIPVAPVRIPLEILNILQSTFTFHGIPQLLDAPFKVIPQIQELKNIPRSIPKPSLPVPSIPGF